VFWIGIGTADGAGRTGLWTVVGCGATGGGDRDPGSVGIILGSAGTGAGAGAARVVDCIDDNDACIDAKTASAWLAPVAFAGWAATADRSAAAAIPPIQRFGGTPDPRSLSNLLNISPPAPNDICLAAAY